MIVRAFKHTDVDGVLAVELRSFEPDYAWTVDELLAVLDDGRIGVIVAEVRGRIVGFIAVRGLRRIINLAVHPDFRRQRIGYNLLLNVKRAVQGKLFVTVKERNLECQLFFRACGFKAVRVLKQRFSDSEDGYLMKWSAVETATTA